MESPSMRLSATPIACLLRRGNNFIFDALYLCCDKLELSSTLHFCLSESSLSFLIKFLFSFYQSSIVLYYCV